MALKIWQIVLVIIIILALAYFVFWLRRFLVERDIQRVKDKFQEPLSKVKFKDLDNKTQERILNLKYELTYKLEFRDDQTMDLLVQIYKEVKMDSHYSKKVADEIYNIMENIIGQGFFIDSGVEIEVDGKNIKSTYGKLDCVYFESATFYYTKGSDSANTWDKGSKGKEPFFVLVDELTKHPELNSMLTKDEKTGKYKMNVKPSDSLRLFMSPTFQKEFTKNNAPNKQTKERLKEGLVSGRLVDYCLQKGKKYYMKIKEDSYEYGAPDEKGHRLSSSITFIQISDKEFKQGKPQVEETPEYQGWIYG